MEPEEEFEQKYYMIPSSQKLINRIDRKSIEGIAYIKEFIGMDEKGVYSNDTKLLQGKNMPKKYYKEILKRFSIAIEEEIFYTVIYSKKHGLLVVEEF